MFSIEKKSSKWKEDEITNKTCISANLQTIMASSMNSESCIRIRTYFVFCLDLYLINQPLLVYSLHFCWKWQIRKWEAYLPKMVSILSNLDHQTKFLIGGSSLGGDGIEFRSVCVGQSISERGSWEIPEWMCLELISHTKLPRP